MPIAGWYADPAGGPGDVRWWDGDRWTDHTREMPIIEIAAADEVVDGDRVPQDAAHPRIAASSEAAAAALRVAASSDAAATSAAVESAEAAEVSGSAARSTTATAVAGRTAAPVRPAATPATWSLRRVLESPRVGLIGVLMVGGVVLLIAMGVLLGGLRSEPPVGPAGRVFATHQGTLAEELEAWETELTLLEPTTVTIDVRSEDFDAVLHLIRDGDEIAWNDDRGDRAVRLHGGGLLDPLLEIRLPADTYILRVSTWSGDTGEFDVTISR